MDISTVMYHIYLYGVPVCVVLGGSIVVYKIMFSTKAKEEYEKRNKYNKKY